MPIGIYTRKKKPIKERFESKFVVSPNGCWEWQTRISPFGYGQFSISSGDCWQAHRLSFVLYVGKIPKGKCVLHRCDNRKCVNPKHLWIGTQADNVRDMMLKGRGIKADSEDNGGAKLNWQEVYEIRRLRKEKKIYYKDLAKMFNVHTDTIERIIHNETWKL